jgi:cytochrome c2
MSEGYRRYGVVALLLALSFRPALAQQSAGAELFEDKCAACHSLGPERGVGPDWPA